MKQLFFGILYFLSFTTIGAQTKHWVYFTDKPNKTLGVSEKAVERYQKSGYGITEQDYIVSPKYLTELRAIKGVTIRLTSRWLNAVSVELDNFGLLSQIEQLPFVKSSSNLKSFKRSIEPQVQQKEQILGHGQLTTGYNQLNANFLHERGFTGEGVTIAVIDNGFRNANNMSAYKHVFDEGRVLGYYDFVDNDTDVFDNTSGTHGEHVWSFIAGRLGGYVGTAPNAKFWLFRTEADYERLIEEDFWLAAAEKADSVGVDIITTSLNYTTFDNDIGNHSYSDMDGNTTIITNAADEAAKRGIFVVSSAGNYGREGHEWHYIGAPADGDSVVAVGAVDENSTIADFSSYGPTYDGRLKPDVLAWGKNAPYINGYDQIKYGNGTSFAAPIIAGLVACLWQAHPEKTAHELRQALRVNAQRYAKEVDNQLGYGLTNFCAAHKMLGGSYCYYTDLGSRIVERVYTNDNKLTAELLVTELPTNIKLRLYDLHGKELIKASKTFNSTIGLKTIYLDLTNIIFRESIYVLKVESNDEVFIQKIFLN